MRYMMATVAYHQMGDLSHQPPDICHIEREDDLNYYGHRVTGLGLINVQFPKATTRELTEEERHRHEGMELVLGGTRFGTIHIEGNPPQSK